MTDHNTQVKQVDCCSTQASQAAQPTGPVDRIGRLSTPAAVGSAILSSACCWLPLLLLAFGLSAGGVAGFFETVRPFFLAAAVIFLGAGFYFAYFRKPACKPGEACAVPNPKLQRFNRVMLWVATVFVLAFALFPYYGPALIRAFAEPTPNAVSTGPGDSSAALTTRTYRVDGMTCAACAAGLEVQLTKLPGVVKARVSYDEGTAVVISRPDEPSEQAVRSAVEQSGFKLGQQQ